MKSRNKIQREIKIAGYGTSALLLLIAASIINTGSHYVTGALVTLLSVIAFLYSKSLSDCNDM